MKKPLPKDTKEKVAILLENKDVANFLERLEANKNLGRIVSLLEGVVSSFTAADLKTAIENALQNKKSNGIKIEGQGVTTIKGKDGAQGPQGEKGEKGDKGDKGDSVQGPQGKDGPIGATGKQGPRGEKGDKGDAGKDADNKKILSELAEKFKVPAAPTAGEVARLIKIPIDDLVSKVIAAMPPAPSTGRRTTKGARTISAMEDVTLTTLSNNDVLTYDSTLRKWKNAPSSGGGGTWGTITGTISDQTDLQTALNAKQNTITTGTTAQYLRGDLSLATFPTSNSSFTNGAGYVVGPASATDNAIVRFDLTTGKLVQNSAVTVGDNGDITITVPSGTQETKGGINMEHTNGTGTSRYRISQDEYDLFQIKRTGDTTGDGAVWAIMNLVSPNASATSGDNESTFSLTTKSGYGASNNVSRTLDIYNDEYNRDNGMGMRQLYKNTTANPIRFENHDKTTNNGAFTLTGCNITSGAFTFTYTTLTGVTPSADDWVWDNAGTYFADDTKITAIDTGTKTITINRAATGTTAAGSFRGKNIKEIMRLNADRQLLVRKFIATDSANVAEFGGAVLVDGNLTMGTLFKINAATGNPEFNFQEAGTTRAKTYYDVVNDRLVFQNNQNNAADAIYFADPITTTGNVTLGGNLIMAANSITMTGSIAATGARVTKGWFTDIESTNAPTVGGVVVPTISSTNTFTNKRVTKRTGTTTSSATPTINTDTVDFYSITAQSGNITSMTTNLSGTPTEAQTLWLALTATSGTPTITWGTSFESGAATLPSGLTTTRLDVGLIWNTITSKWRCVAAG